MNRRLLSGSPGLDAVLGGGLLANSTSLIIGLPGSGKTILAQQCVFLNATRDRPGIYCSTVSESLEKLLGFAQSQAYFDRAALGERVFYEDLSGPLHSGGLPEVLDQLTRLFQERRPGLIAIDSFKALRPYATSEEGFRRFLHSLAERAAGFALSSLWVGEYGPAQLESMPEAAVADAIVSLGTESCGARDRRMIRVLKLRGSAFLSGAHSYRITDRGLEAFPRLADPVEVQEYEVGSASMGSGIPGLDEMVGGFTTGTSILLVGPPGVGKTVLGLHFILEGARHGEPGIIATFQENPSQLERVAQGFGLTLGTPGLTVLHRAPVDLLLDQWVYDLLDAVAATGARRVMIDSLGDLSAAAWDQGTFHEYLYSLMQRLSRAGLTAIMTLEATDLFGMACACVSPAAHIVDNVLLMYFVDREGLWTRALRVLKSRGRSHSSAEAPFRIRDRGMEVVPGGE